MFNKLRVFNSTVIFGLKPKIYHPQKYVLSLIEKRWQEMKNRAEYFKIIQLFLSTSMTNAQGRKKI